MPSSEAITQDHLAPVWEPCGPGCACSSLTMVCWGPVDAKPRCMCPDDCNCRHPHRVNYCGCKLHGEV